MNRLFSKVFTTRALPAHSGNKPKDNPATAKAAVVTFFSNPGCIVLLLLTVGFLLFRFSLGAISWLDLAIVVVVLVGWPMLEWGIHVVLLHNHPRRLGNKTVDFLLPQTHRWHHADPWNLQWVFIPPHIFPLVVPALVAIVIWLSPTLAIASTVLAVYFLLALHYEWVHFLAHIRWCPPIKYYQRRVREHRLHHFRNERCWWGVSMGLGDRLMGTAPEATDVDVSANTADIIG